MEIAKIDKPFIKRGCPNTFGNIVLFIYIYIYIYIYRHSGHFIGEGCLRLSVMNRCLHFILAVTPLAFDTNRVRCQRRQDAVLVKRLKLI